MPLVPTRDQLLALPPEYLAQDISPDLIRTSIGFLVATTLIFALSALSRLCFVQQNGWETYTLYPLAYLNCVAISILGILQVKIGGVGRHSAYWIIHDAHTIDMSLKLEAGSEFVYMVGITIPKVCILLLYLGIFKNHRARFITWAVMGVVVCFYLAVGVFTWLFVCSPFDRTWVWDKASMGGKCGNIMTLYRYISLPNIITDLVIIALPISTVLGLHVSNWQKLGIFLTFLMGGLGIVTAVIRFVAFFLTDLEKDYSYYSRNALIYTIMEQNAYFICSCLPSMRPLVAAASRRLSIVSGKTSLRLHKNGSRESRPSKELLETTNQKNGHVALVFTGERRRQQQFDDEDGLIWLHETIDVESASTQKTT